MARVQIQLRRGTSAQWASIDPVLASGEPGYETDTGRQKIGDGVSSWSELPFSGGSGSGGELPAYTYTQTTPAATWALAHPLGRRPIVEVYLATGERIIADVLVTPTAVTVTHASPVAGSLELR